MAKLKSREKWPKQSTKRRKETKKNTSKSLIDKFKRANMLRNLDNGILFKIKSQSLKNNGIKPKLSNCETLNSRKVST